MKILELAPQMVKRVGFELRYGLLLPRSSGCYVLANIYDEVLYIGQTECLRRRMEDHWKDPRMTQRTRLGLATWFYYQDCPVSDLLAVERSLLSKYYFEEIELPPLNRMGP